MLTAAKKCAMMGKTNRNIFLPSPRKNKKTGKKGKRCKLQFWHIMYTRKGLSSPREGAKMGKKGAKKDKNGQKREWGTPVFRLNKGRADILADTKYLCGKRMDALTD